MCLNLLYVHIMYIYMHLLGIERPCRRENGFVTSCNFRFYNLWKCGGMDFIFFALLIGESVTVFEYSENSKNSKRSALIGSSDNIYFPVVFSGACE